MSFPELLEAVKRLPRAEKVQLLHTLVDEVSAGTALTVEELFFLENLKLGGTVHGGWQVTTDEAGWQSIQQVLDEIKTSK